MRRLPERIDPSIYVRAFPVLGRNLGICAAPLVAAIVAAILTWANGPLFDPVGGALNFITGIISALVEGFAFGVALIFADDAWRHGRGNLRSAWESARRRAGDILIASIGFFFLITVARMIGGFIPVPYFGEALGAAAVWAFIYTLPAAAIGGTPGGAALNTSLQTSKRHPFATSLLVIVCLVVWFGLTGYAMAAIAPYLSFLAVLATQILFTSIALGYIATIVARQYSDYAFRPYW